MPGQSLFVGGPADTDRFLGTQDARNALSGLLATNSADPMDIRLGVLYSGDTVLITGTAGLNVTVNALGFVSSKGAANGVYVGNSRADATVAVPAAPALGSKRLDVLWVQQQDKGATVTPDANTQAVFGVTAGDATTGTPGRNAIPAGAQEVGTILWDSTSVVATATNAAQCTLATTCQWTTTRGNPIPVRSQSERDSTLTGFKGLRALRLDADGAIDVHDGTAWRTGVWTDFTPTLYNDPAGAKTAIGATVGYARYRYLDAHTIHAQVNCARQAGGTVSSLGISLPAPGAFRSLNCGTLVVSGSSAPAGQSLRAYMSPDQTTLIPTALTNGFLSVDPLQSVSYDVTYQV